ncbi:MAG: PEP/pyruvate-binding domain-containing protein, partial [Coriobacteriia bacterium]|nr:PEP/pyruvate-binding domain-containing protein [Coriobacteriia bacterium]
MNTRADIGPKADALRRLAEAGLPVPDARFLGARCFRDHAARAGLAALLETGEPLDAAAVRAAILSTDVDPAVEDLLRRWHFDLGGGHLAVRSSADAEDLPTASFAGQHGTYFVADPDGVVARTRDCWASLFSDRAVAYRERNGIAHADVAMAVIVQRLIPAVSAGVAFTANPLDGSTDVCIESCFGLGEVLVSGKVTPDRFVVARESFDVLDAVAGDKRVRIAEDDGGDVIEQAVDDVSAATFSITGETARGVARLALRAEAQLGSPADVEWAFDGKRLWLLQARPITALPAPSVPDPAPVPQAAPAPAPEPEPAPAAAPVVAPVPAPTPTPTPVPTAAPDGPVVIWSNVNTGEILPDVVTPMTWSIIYGHADDLFGGMMGALGARVDTSLLVGLVGGRVYFNLSLLRDAFSHLPGVNPDIALGGLHDYIDLPPAEPASRRGHLAARMRAASGMPGYITRHTPKRATAFAAHMRSTTNAGLDAIASADDAPQSLTVLEDLVARFAEFADALAFMAVSMFGFGVLGGVCAKWLGDTTGALSNRLVAGSGDVASAEAGLAMWHLGVLARGDGSVGTALAESPTWDALRASLEKAGARGDIEAMTFLDAWDLFMVEHGHHRRGELEFANPTWAETPDYVLGIVRSYADRDAADDPVLAFRERAADAKTAAARCRARLHGWRLAVFERVLGWGRASARTRETIKSEAVRWMVAIRHALLALGARAAEDGTIDRADDIFFLEYADLRQLVDDPGSRDWRAIVTERRTEHARLERLAPPPVVLGHWDDTSAPWKVATESRVLTGISVSAGVARGPAR